MFESCSRSHMQGYRITGGPSFTPGTPPLQPVSQQRSFCPSFLSYLCYRQLFSLFPERSNGHGRPHIPQFRERKNRIVNRPDQADEGPVDEELAALKSGYANVTHCGCARGQCLQNTGKSSAS